MPSIGRTSITIVAAVLAVACGSPSTAPEAVDAEAPATTGDDGDREPSEPTRDDGALTDAPTDDGIPDALAVSGRRLDGGSYDLSQLNGTAVAIWMWAPW